MVRQFPVLPVSSLAGDGVRQFNQVGPLFRRQQIDFSCGACRASPRSHRRAKVFSCVMFFSLLLLAGEGDGYVSSVNVFVAKIISSPKNVPVLNRL